MSMTWHRRFRTASSLAGADRQLLFMHKQAVVCNRHTSNVHLHLPRRFQLIPSHTGDVLCELLPWEMVNFLHRPSHILQMYCEKTWDVLLWWTHLRYAQLVHTMKHWKRLSAACFLKAWCFGCLQTQCCMFFFKYLADGKILASPVSYWLFFHSNKW